jgi:two-component system, LytTR family, sensor kinase
MLMPSYSRDARGPMTKYWNYQLAGWLGYSAVGITINLLGGAPLGPLLAGHVVLVSSGIGLTHLLRHEIHRRRSPNTPMSHLWPLLASSSVAISIVLAALVIGVSRAVDVHSTWDFMSGFALWWGMLLATGVWVILYVRFSEQRRQELRESHLQLVIREARLLALETQINPHFLFNALNSIRALVEIDPGRAQDMLTRLSNVLRNSLRRDDGHTVTLASELENVSDYLALEMVRFADKLQSSITVDEAASQCHVPRMVLQTLVENAVKHGIGQTKGRGDLLIRASANSHNLLIAVENTGRLSPSGRDGVLQLGLQNIQERLKLLYGNRASLRLEENGDRVIATVAIPVVV